MSSLLSALARSGKVVRDDRGVTLAETIVAMALMLVVSGIVAAAFVSNSNGTTQITDDARGQQDMQIVGERITRDIRMARGVDSGSTDSYLVIWIDNNSNYRRDVGETVTWRFASAGGDHCLVTRSDDAGSSKVEANTVINGSCRAIFTYTPPSPSPVTSSTLVTVTLQYDAFINRGANPRTLTFSVRMRNAS